MQQWIIRHSGGSIQTGQQADGVLLVFVVLALCVSAALLLRQGAPADRIVAPPGESVLFPSDEPPLLR